MGACVAIDKTKCRKQESLPVRDRADPKNQNIKRLKKLTSAPETRSKITVPVFASNFWLRFGFGFGLFSRPEKKTKPKISLTPFSFPRKKVKTCGYRLHRGRFATISVEDETLFSHLASTINADLSRTKSLVWMSPSIFSFPREKVKRAFPFSHRKTKINMWGIEANHKH